ncbi:RNA-directed DNA polymerase, eukaryota, reverse transcriptase zinc-binding domain protein [Tanacetum coccineum]|uniref:RNA-directed DNA polymerase, eukaryota, reverse transcriptase zinc-binding domain protein n=1 Tax=Tanacetum coccineum TaxID=301880 RepID=A0ABQ5I2V6_9ASTR
MEEGKGDIEDVFDVNSGIAKDLSPEEVVGIERRSLWDDLRRAKSTSRGCPWILMGDFNVTLKLEEHSAGGSKVNGEMLEFKECLNDIERPKEEFISTVSNEWKNECEGYSMFKLVKKMKRMKIPMNNLAWKNGNIFQNVKNLEEKLKRSQEEVEANPYCKKAKENLSKIFQEYNVAVEDEEKLLAQKAKIKWLSEGDKNTIFFHNIIKSRMHSNRILEVCDNHGNWFDGDNVAMQFVKHFKSFLGDNKSTEQIQNPEELFSNKLTANEAEEMIKDVTNEEIKEAMFGIGNDKAPGPRWIYCCFLQEKLEHLSKIQHPSKVSDYRPIACCNVIYKCISKIITKRLQGCLDKLVSMNQSAFVPGRLIEDNLLITQELLKGYNRKNGPQRCAFKIDIAKAYDFLKQILTHFGFHKKIIEWIMTCVSSTAFSINVNGERHGYFKSGRGLRQGDPMSPYLFTLVMEVLTLMVQRRVSKSNQFKLHWGCKELKLTQLCFADDLLMLCNGDHHSVEVLKQGLMEFSGTSGLIPNMNKSTIFFGSVKEIEKQRILEIMPFAVGKLPMKYLGVPLITKNIGIAECNQLVDRVKQTSQGDLKRGSAKVAWKDICAPKSQGGLGIKRLGPWNETLLCKHLWNLITKKESLWVKWVYIVRLKEKSIWNVEIDENDSGTWKKRIINLREKVRKLPLKTLSEGLKVAEMINNKVWKWPSEWNTKFSWIKYMRTPNLKKGKNDCNVWMDDNGNRGKFSIRKVWDIFKENKHEISWHKAVWFSQCNPRHAFILWLAMHGRLATQDRIMAWNKQKDLLCPLCNKVNDSHEHLFFRCQYSAEIWESLTDRIGIHKWDIDWRKMMDEIAINCRNSIQSVLNRMIMTIAVYYIWTERRIFTDEKRNSQRLLEGMVDSIKMQLMGIKVKNSPAIKKISKEWNIKMNCRE